MVNCANKIKMRVSWCRGQKIRITGHILVYSYNGREGVSRRVKGRTDTEDDRLRSPLSILWVLLPWLQVTVTMIEFYLFFIQKHFNYFSLNLSPVTSNHSDDHLFYINYTVSLYDLGGFTVNWTVHICTVQVNGAVFSFFFSIWSSHFKWSLVLPFTHAKKIDLRPSSFFY